MRELYIYTLDIQIPPEKVFQVCFAVQIPSQEVFGCLGIYTFFSHTVHCTYKSWEVDGQCFGVVVVPDLNQPSHLAKQGQPLKLLTIA